MTDAEFVFKEDIRERKQMKSGAMHKKNGSKSKKCTLPSDYLTTKKKKKLNGPVTTINMSKPYNDWKEFLGFPKDLQAEYINGLIKNYGARCRDIADMFHMSYQSVWQRCRTYDPPINFGGAGGNAHQEIDNRWLDFVSTPDAIEANKKFVKEELSRLNHSEEKKVEPVAEESPIIKEAKDYALYLKSFYDECLAIGFGEAMAQTLTVEQCKVHKLAQN